MREYIEVGGVQTSGWQTAGWQPLATAVVVLLAVVYLVWKMGFQGSRPNAKKRRGPDVPLSRLTKKKR